MPLQIRRGTDAERQVLATAPQAGELVWITDQAKLYVGDGTTLLKDLEAVTGFNAEDAQDAVANMLVAGPNTGISFTYNDGGNTISATANQPQLLQNLDLNSFNITGSGGLNITGNSTINGNLTVEGKIVADYNGSVFGDDSTILVNAVEGAINLSGTVKDHIVPGTADTHNVGAPGTMFNNVYVKNGVWVDGAVMTNNGGAIELPAGSTVGGLTLGGVAEPGANVNANIIGDDSSTIVNTSDNSVTATSVTATSVTAAAIDGDLKGSVYSDDSTVIVNSNTRTIIAETVTGDLRGSVSGDDSTILVDAIASQIKGNVNNDTVDTGNIVLNKNLATGGLFLETQGDGEDDYDLFTIQAYNDGADAPAQQVVKTRGTKASPAAIQNGDGIFRHVYSAYGSTTPASLGLSVVLDATADGAIAANQIPGKYEIITANAAGTLALAVAFNSKQETVFGGPAQLKSYTTTQRDALTAVAGQMIYNSTTSKIQAYAGSSWVDLH
tara:strand:+ start:899 stop:2392 length:1494 start_codon:yes stop_codon:yes gene_type:complete